MGTRTAVSEFFHSDTVLGRTADYMLVFLLVAVVGALLLGQTGSVAALTVLVGSTALAVLVAVFTHDGRE